MLKNKVTMVCTSKNPDRQLLEKMLESAKGFYEVLLHIDGFSLKSYKNGALCEYWDAPKSLNIPDAYNNLIECVTTEWVCCFCDDDYFYPEGLAQMLAEVEKGIEEDVAHFKFHVSGYLPKEDIRGYFYKFLGKKEYELSEKLFITPELFLAHNRLPAGSFFRKSAWEKVGGFQGEKCHDWDLWKRMSQVGCTFKYFDYLVYNFVRRENSAWIRQHRS